MTEFPFNDWAQARRERFNKIAEEVLPSADDIPQKLHEAMRYAVIGGGKRVRPLLVYAAAETTGGSLENADLAALAVEMVHSYSLIHDDLPCMDNDMMRHGKPSTHAKFGEAMAMLAGDALQPEAFLCLSRLNVPDSQKCELNRLLAYASSTRGMCGGQAIDLDSVGKVLSYDSLKQMHERKTGALLEASVLMGANIGNPEEVTPEVLEGLSRFGKLIGLAFQIVDDILDVTADSATLGKTAGKDEQENKPTYVSILGLEKARETAKQLHEEAVETLRSLPLKNKESSRRLEEIAEYIIKRSY